MKKYQTKVIFGSGRSFDVAKTLEKWLNEHLGLKLISIIEYNHDFIVTYLEEDNDSEVKA